MRHVDRLLSSFTDPIFIAKHWQKEPKVWNDLKKYFIKTSNFGNYLKLIDRHLREFPDSLAFLVKGKQVDFNQITASDDLATNDLLQYLQWHPMLVQSLYLSNEFFAQLATLMQYHFNAFTPTSAYFSYGGTRGAKKHRDRSHIFVFQFDGKCRWILHSKNKRTEIMDVVMKPGMVMYVPQGIYHRVERISDFNAHVTMGLRFLHPRDEMQQMLRNPILHPALPDELLTLSANAQTDLLEKYSNQPLVRDN
mgnify:CR=1 FL=1